MLPFLLYFCFYQVYQVLGLIGILLSFAGYFILYFTSTHSTIRELSSSIAMWNSIIYPFCYSTRFYFETTFNLNESVVELYVIFCVLFTIARELIKDIEDINGDLTIQSKTFPIVFGITLQNG